MVADQRKNSSFAGLKLWAQAVLPISAETQKVTLLISLFYVAGDKILSWALNSHLMFSFSFFLNNISPRGKNKWFIFGAFIFGDGPNMHGDAPKLNDPSYPLFFFWSFFTSASVARECNTYSESGESTPSCPLHCDTPMPLNPQCIDNPSYLISGRFFTLDVEPSNF